MGKRYSESYDVRTADRKKVRKPLPERFSGKRTRGISHLRIGRNKNEMIYDRKNL